MYKQAAKWPVVEGKPLLCRSVAGLLYCGNELDIILNLSMCKYALDVVVSRRALMNTIHCVGMNVDFCHNVADSKEWEREGLVGY